MGRPKNRRFPYERKFSRAEYRGLLGPEMEREKFERF